MYPAVLQIAATAPDALARALRLSWALLGLLAFAMAGLVALVLVRRAARRHADRLAAHAAAPSGGAGKNPALDPWSEAARRLDPPPPPRFTDPGDDDTVDIDPGGNDPERRT